MFLVTGLSSTSLPKETAIKVSSRFYSSTKFISTTVIFSSLSGSTGKAYLIQNIATGCPKKMG